jgi:hypothetical protein
VLRSVLFFSTGLKLERENGFGYFPDYSFILAEKKTAPEILVTFLFIFCLAFFQLQGLGMDNFDIFKSSKSTTSHH